MIIVGPAIIMGVDDSEMTGKFMDEVMDVPAQISVTRVETDPDFGRINSVQDPQDVARVSEKQMRQFVFQDADNAQFFAAPGNLIQ